MRKIIAVCGTRPEQIKLRPVVRSLAERDFELEILFTNQSPDLAGEFATGVPVFEMSGRWSSLNDGIQRTMFEARHRIQAFEPDAVLVQGDTASAFAGAVGAYLERVPVGHIEAGLRTYRENPRPEEAFRGAIARFVDWHFCPDERSYRNLVDEGVGRLDNAFITGNPVIDTLPNEIFYVLVTLHRRENWGEPIENALAVLHDFAQTNESVLVEVIEHPNWSEAVGCRPDTDELGGFIVRKPFGHEAFTDAVQEAALVVTDSGGLQEEAAYFGTDCVVYREATERTALEALEAVEVVDPGSGTNKLRNALERRLSRREAYGRGDAGAKIAKILDQEIPPSDENQVEEPLDSKASVSESLGPDLQFDYSLGN